MRHRLSTHLRTLAAGLALAVVIGGASTALAATSPRKAFHPSAAKTAGSLARQRPSGGRAVAPIGNDISNATTLTPAARVTTINGSVTTDPSELDEVYRVFLIAGEVVDVSMSAGANTDFGLAVFDDSATSVWDDALELVLPAYYGGPDSYPAAVSFKAPYSGYYWLDVYSWVDDSGDNGGSGAYSMDVTFTRSATILQLSPVANMTFGGTTSVSGTVTGRKDFGETATGDVLLSLSYDGVTYLPWRSTSLDSEGHFSFTGLSPVAKVYYLAHYEGTAALSPSAGHTTVNTTALLSTVASKRYGARSYTLSGTLNPWHPAGTSAVRIYLWKYVSGKYKAMGYRSAKLSDLSYYSKFSTNYKFPSTGKWRLQAYHSDSDHLKTTSAYSYVSVK